MTTASMQPGSRRKQTAINVAIVLTFIGFALFPFLCIVGEMLLGSQAIRLWFEGPGFAESPRTPGKPGLPSRLKVQKSNLESNKQPSKFADINGR